MASPLELAQAAKSYGDIQNLQNEFDARKAMAAAQLGQAANQAQLAPLQLQGAQLDLQTKQRMAAVQALQGATPDNYGQIKQQIGGFAPDIAQTLPDQYSKDYVNSQAMGLITPEQRFTLQNTMAQQAETARHNRALEGNARSRMGMSYIDPDTGEMVQTPGSANFGFQDPRSNPVQYRALISEDSARQKNYGVSQPFIQKALDDITALEPNIDKIGTGAGAPAVTGAQRLANYVTGGLAFPDSSVAAANIDKGTNALISDLQGAEHVPGSRGSNLQLGILQSSKPGLGQPNETNHNIINELKGKLTDQQLGNELFQQYRTSSPAGISDPNFTRLADALSTIYPTMQVDPATSKVSFNKDNADAYRNAMQDAIANPQKYLQKAQAIKTGGSTSSPQASSGGFTIGQTATGPGGQKIVYTQQGWQPSGR